jgi:hypothetical protein
MSHARSCAGLALMLFLFSLVIAQEERETPLQRTERILDQNATAEFVEMPLGDLLKNIKEYGLPVELSLEGAKVDLKKTVSLNLKRMSLRSILSYFLDRHGLYYTVKPNGTLVIEPAPGGRLPAYPESKQQLAAKDKLTKLMQEETTLQFITVPLKDVVAFMADQHDCVVTFDPRLSDFSKLVDEPVTCRLQDTSLKDALRALGAPLDLQPIVRYEMIMLTAREKREDAPRDERLEKAYATEINLEAKEYWLTNLAAKLSAQSKVPIVLDRYAILKAAKIDPTTTVKLEAKGVPLRDILKLIPEPKLKFEDRDGVILITPVTAPK